MKSNLLPCPLCGCHEETSIVEKRLSPTMKGPGALVSVNIKHWCSAPNRARIFINVTGSDYKSAAAAWNYRGGKEDEPGFS